MKKAIQEQWVEALRSGDYQQNNGTLRAEVGDNRYNYCVMGVLADVAVKQGVIAEDEAFSEVWGGVPPELLEWAGISDQEQDWFIDLNDEHDVTFNRFADLLTEAAAEETTLTSLLDKEVAKHHALDDYIDDEDDEWEDDPTDEPEGTYSA